jgi:hypothetical protein
MKENVPALQSPPPEKYKMSYGNRQVYAATTKEKGLYLLAYGLEVALLLDCAG